MAQYRSERLDYYVEKFGKERARDILALYAEHRLALMPIPLGKKVFQAGYELKDNGTIYWTIEQKPFTLELYPEIGKTVFETMDDVEKYIRKIDEKLKIEA